MSSPTEAARSLLRVVIRTFHPNPKQIFLFDALLTYNVLNVDEMVRLFPPHMAQPKEIRALLNPLRVARMVSVGSRQELKAGATKSTQREYYFVNYHEAVDAVKYRIVRVQDKVQDLYKQVEGQRKDWWCPRCRAEYDELSILDKLDPERGFYCDRCGETLNQNEAAVKERGDHAKIRNLNDQLRAFNSLLSVIDSGEVQENAFEDAFAHKREIPEDDSLGAPQKPKYIEVAQQKSQEKRKQQALVDEKALGINIMAEKDQEARDAQIKKEKSRLNAHMNTLPDWHSNSIKVEAAGVREDGGASPSTLASVKRELDDQKPDLRSEDRKMNDELDDVYQQILLEREEEERKRKEAEAEDEDDGEFDDEDEDEFEDAGPSVAGTPMSSQQQGFRQEITPTKRGVNGNALKRELDADGDSISGTDTGANTPADTSFTSMPDTKRIKLEHGNNTVASIPAIAQAGGDSEEDDDFEDVS